MGRLIPKRLLLVAPLVVLAARRAYRLHASGAITVDLGRGRRTRPLGPVVQHIAAPRDVVFDVIAHPYLGRQTRAMAEKIEIWERGSDMVLAAHHTKVKCGVTTTVETVRFTRPERIDFRVVRAPVPHVRESFQLRALANETELTWNGELGTDFGGLGARWGDTVARSWERAVRESLLAIATEAERLAARPNAT
jgi:Polyketide cyclase / dehydrase and lipid transport